ncbi:D-glycero-D-manno-heptose 1,7-bisphosphate phosphatase [Streptomyces albaduncus]|uniref:D,D-heptose 1,7-bisphosphate phosphatase n=1 Tax=Streptomyces griseoloalbus TaxID=67303 RepID=A0A7W8BSJ7_9ACTN|nr:D-glycero-D-manno-heptose 1,7-bisphosphate phosphatase [Streptomyces albaduncus]
MLIENRDTHVRRVSDVALIPGAVDAVRRLSMYRDVVIVTNQAVIERDSAPAEEILAVHQCIVDTLTAAGADIVGSVICPHDPARRCVCRKPEPGMLFAASRAWGCRVEGGWMVGDAITDVQAGVAAGCRTMLVRTGRGVVHESDTRRVYPDCVVAASLACGLGRLLA